MYNFAKTLTIRNDSSFYWTEQKCSHFHAHRWLDKIIQHDKELFFLILWQTLRYSMKSSLFTKTNKSGVILVRLNQIHFHSPRLFTLQFNILSSIHSYVCKLVTSLQVLRFPCTAHRQYHCHMSVTSHPASFHLHTSCGRKAQSLVKIVESRFYHR